MGTVQIKSSVLIAMAAAATFAAVWPAAAIDCTCRFRGSDFQLGDQVCLNTPNGLTMAQCQMVLNNTSWRLLEEQCPLGQNATPLFDVQPGDTTLSIDQGKEAEAG